jgi:PAS domain S-box-containing protein
MPIESSLPGPGPELFRALVEQGRDVFFRYRPGPPAAFDYVSPSVAELTGYPVEAFMANPSLFSAIVHPDDRALVPGANDVGGSSTIRWLREDGGTVWVEQRTVPITGPNGALVAVEGVARDITTQARALEAIRGSEHAFRALLDRIDLVAAIVDPGGRMTFVKGRVDRARFLRGVRAP